MRCPGCGQKVPQGQICTNCNSITYAVRRPVSPAASLCPKCGEALEDGDDFCSQCGEPVARAAARPAWKVLLIGLGLAAVLLGGSFAIILMKERRRAPVVVQKPYAAPLVVDLPLGPFGDRGFFLRPPRGTEVDLTASKLGVLFGDPQEHGLVVSVDPISKTNPKPYSIVIYGIYSRSGWDTNAALMRYRDSRAVWLRNATIPEGYSTAVFDAAYSPGTTLKYEYLAAFMENQLLLCFDRVERGADGLYCVDVRVSCPLDRLDRRPIPPTAAEAFERLPEAVRRDVETVLRNLAMGEAADRAFAKFPASTAAQPLSEGAKVE